MFSSEGYCAADSAERSLHIISGPGNGSPATNVVVVVVVVGVLVVIIFSKY